MLRWDASRAPSRPQKNISRGLQQGDPLFQGRGAPKHASPTRNRFSKCRDTPQSAWARKALPKDRPQGRALLNANAYRARNAYRHKDIIFSAYFKEMLSMA